MIVNTTYHSNENKELIKDIIGSPFSFLQSLRLGGVGSKRMMIDELSPSLNGLLNTVSDINYANVELRPNGILVHINKGLKNYSWAIPFYQLVLYKTDGFSIHAQGKYVRFKNNRLLKENAAFIKKMIQLKTESQLKLHFNGPIAI